MDSRTSSFVATSAAWTPIRFAAPVKAWTMWTSGGSMKIRGRDPGAYVALDAAIIVDNEDGTISIAAAAHGLTVGDEIFIPRGTLTSLVLGGTYTLEAATDTGNLCITAVPTGDEMETVGANKWVHGYKDAVFPLGSDSDVEIQPLQAGQILFYVKAVSTDVTVNFRYVG